MDPKSFQWKTYGQLYQLLGFFYGDFSKQPMLKWLQVQ